MQNIPSQNKKLVVIPGAEHSYRNAETQQYGDEVKHVKQELSDWLRDINRLAP